MSRARVVGAFFAVMLIALGSAAQPVDIRTQVLDLVFPIANPPSYFSRMILRFDDAQLAVIVYPGSKTEITRQQLTPASVKRLREFREKAVNDRTITAKQVADELIVDVSKAVIDYKRDLEPSLKKLGRIRISPLIASRVALDDYSEFQFSQDFGQEAVRYTLVGPFNGEPQDALTKWMLEFRKTSDAWLKPN